MIRSRSGRCVAFDLDDTLYDEMDYVRSGFAAVALAVHERFGTDVAAGLGAALDRAQPAGAFDAAVREYGLPADALAFMIETYRGHRPDIRLREGARDTLEAARRRDGVVGCITDGRSATQRQKLAALGLERFFEVLLISEETGHAKPDPFNFRELMRLVAADRFWYVADNPAKDFVAPNALGWTTVGIASGRGVHRPEGEVSAGYPPRHRVAGFQQLQDLLG